VLRTNLSSSQVLPIKRDDVAPTIISTPNPIFLRGTADVYDMTQHVQDIGVSAISYTLTNTPPSGVVLNPITGILSYNGIGAATVSSQQLVATNEAGSATSEVFDIEIQATDQPPVIISTPAPFFFEGSAGSYSMAQHVSDDGLSSLTYTLNSGLSSGLSFSTSSGILSYDGAGAVDTSSNSLTATDAIGADTSAPFNIVIAEVATGLEADWQARINQPGVVWYHDFRNVGEVDAFRWSTGLGNNPDDDPGGRAIDTVELDTSDGITGGGCLRVSNKAGTGEGQTWWRQFSPLKGSANASDGRGQGKVEDDPGVDGEITALDWAATPDGNETENWDVGFYGHPDFHNAGKFDGHGYWLQMRIKNDAKHLTDHPSQGGKIFIMMRAGVSLDARQIVVDAKDSEDGINLFSMNRSGGDPLEQDTPGLSNQPGSDFQVGGLCDFSATGSANCWPWSNGWDTYLFHFVPGLGTGDMVVQIWSARPGQTSYTKIWDQDTVDVGFPVAGEEGYNAFTASCFLNKHDLTAEIKHRFDQMIFSKDPVVIPLNAPTALEQRTRGLIDGVFFNSGDGGSPEIPHAPQDTSKPYTWQTRTGFYDPIRRRAHVIGEYYEGGQPYEHHYLDEINNVWVTADITAVPQGASHWRGGCFDVETGRFFWQREAREDIYWYDPDADEWAFHSSHSGIIDGLPTSPWCTGFHPNLFGPGKPGLVHASVWRLHAFEFTDYYNDPTSGSWTHLNGSNFGSSHPLKGQGEAGCATYMPGRDELMITGRGDRDSTNQCIVVHGGAGLLAGSVDVGNGVSVRTNPPKRATGQSNNSKAYLCIHPRKRDRILLMDAADNDTWYSDDGGQTWPSGSTHPFAAQLDNDGKMSVTSLPHHGVVMGITHDNPSVGIAKCCFWKAPI